MFKNRIPILIIACMLLCFAGCAGPDALPEETVTAPTTVLTEPTQEQTVLPTTETTEATAPTLPLPEPEDADFVKVTDYIPDIVVELRYATDHNFTGQRIYDFTELWLRYGTVRKLMAVQATLREQGLRLKVWDGFRPTAAQFKLWEICPDPTYVANPNSGFSSHSRGNTVDVTLVYADGTELVMPTGFDDFSKLADRDYSDCSRQAADNALLLENVMKENGFKPYAGEWWHFSDTEVYPVEQDFLPA